MNFYRFISIEKPTKLFYLSNAYVANDVCMTCGTCTQAISVRHKWLSTAFRGLS